MAEIMGGVIWCGVASIAALCMFGLASCAEVHNAVDYGRCSFEHQNCGN